ncbi:MAG: hypothetical protein RLZZ74_3444 [Cyanobacteriota bacterium]|jgi:hypothetical protein
MGIGGGDLDNSQVILGDIQNGYQPDPSVTIVTTGTTKQNFDSSNRLEIHGSVTSDEGGFRDDFSGVALTAEWVPTNSGTGSNITVGSGRVSILPGTANAGTAKIVHAADYLPMTLQFFGRVSQRIANQTSIFGFQNAAATKQSVCVLDGTVNTTLKFRTSWGSSATEIQETVVTLPGGATTANDQKYSISVSAINSTLAINDVVVARHTLHIPGPYDPMDVVCSVLNAAIVTATTLSFDAIYLNNWDRTQVDNDFIGEPLLTTAYIDNNSTYNQIPRSEPSQMAMQGNAFSWSNSTLTVATAETRLIYLVNSAANTKTIFISTMLLAPGPDNGNYITYNFYYNPTVSANGTAQTIVNLRPGSATASVLSVFITPTVSANGTRSHIFTVGKSDQASPMYHGKLDPYIILTPGNTLLITGSAKANGTSNLANLIWFEAV